MRVKNKREFYALWEAGVLGNRTKLFHTLDEALESGEPKIGFREIGKTGGGAWTLVTMDDTKLRELLTSFPEVIPFMPNSKRDLFEWKVRKTHREWVEAGRTFVMDNAVPNHKSTLQGEVCYTPKGLQSFLAVGSPLPPMRVSIAQGLHKHRGPLETRLLLNQFMDPSSRDDLEQLFDRYPDAAFEFTCFSVNVGEFPRRNTIFWEVRNY